MSGGALLSHTVCNQDHDDDSWLDKGTAVKAQTVMILYVGRQHTALVLMLLHALIHPTNNPHSNLHSKHITQADQPYLAPDSPFSSAMPKSTTAATIKICGQQHKYCLANRKSFIGVVHVSRLTEITKVKIP